MAIPKSFREIADDLTELIRKGDEFPKDANGETPLPSYTELAEKYNVSVSTAARAYGLLTDRGVAVGSRGRGMYVAKGIRKT